MTASWHYSKDSVQHGPIDTKQLHALIADGTVRKADLVWRDGMQAWEPASSIVELVSAFPASRAQTVPPPIGSSAVTAASGSGTKILVLTIIAAFFSIFIGGCTAAVGEKLGAEGADSQAGFGLMQALMGVAGGIWAFRKYNDPSTVEIGGRSFRRLTLAATLILGAAVLSISNALAFITAGVLNAVAGALALMKAKSLPKP